MVTKNKSGKIRNKSTRITGVDSVLDHCCTKNSQIKYANQTLIKKMNLCFFETSILVNF